jgi:D-3-phosphoglycerate dehydrogenase
VKILIVDKVHSHLAESLESMGYEVDNQPNANRHQILSLISDAEGLVIRTKIRVDEEVLSHAGKLKWIARAGAGLDNIDEKACNIRNIKLLHAAGANADAVAEQAIGMLIGLLTNTYKSAVEVRNKIWLRDENTGMQLSHRTVGIIGYGHTGKALANKLSSFGCKILAYDKYLHNYGNEVVKEASLAQIQQECDVITFHVPLTKETQYYLDEDFIAVCKQPFFLLNLSRGHVVNTAALIAGLRSKKILGAGLDVLENEKLDALNTTQQTHFDNLCAMNNVLITPHIGGFTQESFLNIAKVLAQKIKQLTVD